MGIKNELKLIPLRLKLTFIKSLPHKRDLMKQFLTSGCHVLIFFVDGTNICFFRFIQIKVLPQMLLLLFA